MGQFRGWLAGKLMLGLATLAGIVFMCSACSWLFSGFGYTQGEQQTAGTLFMWTLVLLLAAGGIAVYLWHEGELGIPWLPNINAKYARRKAFEGVCQHVGLSNKLGDGKLQHPKLTEVHGTPDNWSGLVRGFVGHTEEDFQREAHAFAVAYGVEHVRFELDSHQNIIMVVSRFSLPVSAEWPWPPEAYAAMCVGKEAELGRAVPLGMDVDGKTVTLAIEGDHWLVAGRTGGGKGSYIWSLVLGLAPAVRVGCVKLWGIDPKRTELAMGPSWWEDRYANTDDGMAELLERAVSDMQQRADAMAGHMRKVTVSKDMPLHVLVIDEIAYLTSLMSDKKLAQRCDKAMKTLLSQGRAIGFCVVAAIQDPRKESLPFRDLLPTRIALGLDGKNLVDLVLGDGAREAGALSDAIPKQGAAGTGYVLVEGGKPKPMRAYWCSDDLILAYSRWLSSGWLNSASDTRVLEVAPERGAAAPVWAGDATAWPVADVEPDGWRESA